MSSRQHRSTVVAAGVVSILVGIGLATPMAQAQLAVKAVAAGCEHSLALTSDGTVWDWGVRLPGLPDGVGVGLGDAAGRAAPTRVKGLGRVVAVASGCDHNLALKEDGTVWAWGNNDRGQLGDGTTINRTTPVKVVGLSGIAAVAAGHGHSLALKDDGTLWAWGHNNSRQLGDGTTAQRATPLEVPGLSGAVAVAAGQTHSLALKSDGTVWVWGGNEAGELWDTTRTYPLAPMRVDGLNGIVSVAAGDRHNLALRDDQTIWAWGSNGGGQLGDGTTTDRAMPVRVSGLDGVVAIAAGGRQSLALKADGTVWEWGRNGDSGFANAPYVDRTAPEHVGGLSGIVAIAAGIGHGLALKKDGTVWAWGGNWAGQLGGGTDAMSSTPVQVSGLAGVVAIAAGRVRSLAATSDRKVWVWGSEFWSQVKPLPVSRLSAFLAAATGGYGVAFSFFSHTLTLKEDGTVWAWGDNANGELGDGTSTDYRSTPVQVCGLSGVASIAAGGAHSLAVKRDGTVWAWGANYQGQLGDEPNATRLTPVQVIQPGSPDLEVAMSHNGDFTPGARGVYTLTITNTGLTATTGLVTVTATLPPGLTHVSASGDGWACWTTDQLVTCTNQGLVEPGSSSVITLTVTVDSAAWPGVTNLATVTNASDRNISNDAIGDPTAVSPGR